MTTSKTRLRISRDGQLMRLAELPAEQEWILGSHPSCDLFIDSALVSLRHVSVLLKPNGLLLKDLNSRHGVYVNGYRVRVATLKHGDCARLGDIQLRFEDFRAPFLSDQCPRVVIEIAPVYVGEHPQRISLQPGLTLLGGEPDQVDVPFRDNFVSGCHAELLLDPHGVCLTDLGSTNGTLLGSKEIRDAWLQDGAQVRLSPRSRFQVEIQPARDPVSSPGVLSARLCVALLVSTFLIIGAYTWMLLNPPPPTPMDKSREKYEWAVSLARDGIFSDEDAAGKPEKKGAETLLKEIAQAGKSVEAYKGASDFLKHTLPRWKKNREKLERLDAESNPRPAIVFQHLLTEISLLDIRYLLDDKAIYKDFQDRLGKALEEAQKECLENARVELKRFDDLLHKNAPLSERESWHKSICDTLATPYEYRLWPNRGNRDKAAVYIRSAKNGLELLRILEDLKRSISIIRLTDSDFDMKLATSEQLLKEFGNLAKNESELSVRTEIGLQERELAELRKQHGLWTELNGLYASNKWDEFRDGYNKNKKAIDVMRLDDSNRLDKMIEYAEEKIKKKEEALKKLDELLAEINTAKENFIHAGSLEVFRKIHNGLKDIPEEIEKVRKEYQDPDVDRKIGELNKEDIVKKREALLDFSDRILVWEDTFKKAEKAGHIAEIANAGFQICFAYNKLMGFQTAPWSLPYVARALVIYREKHAQLRQDETPGAQACLFCLEGRLSRILLTTKTGGNDTNRQEEFVREMGVQPQRSEFFNRYNELYEETNDPYQKHASGIRLSDDEHKKLITTIIKLALALPILPEDDTYYEKYEERRKVLKDIWEKVGMQKLVPELPFVSCDEFFKTLEIP